MEEQSAPVATESSSPLTGLVGTAPLTPLKFFKQKKVIFSLASFLILAIALGAGLFLSKQKQQITSRAGLPPVVFKDANGSDLPVRDGKPYTTSPKVKIQLASPLGPASGVLAATTKDLFGVSVSGPTSGILGEPLAYKASGYQAKTVALFWMKSTDSPTKASSWHKLGESNVNICRGYYANGLTACAVEGKLTPTELGSYYIVANVTNDQLGPCSGSPLLDGKTDKNAQPLPGWSDCGTQDRITLSIASVTASPLPSGQKFTASVSGPTAGSVGQALKYSAQAVSTKNVDVVSIHWAKANADLTQGSSWTKIGQSEFKCWTYAAVGLPACPAEGTFTPKEAGTYYVAAVATGDLGPCSGNPKYNAIPGWKDCGPKSLITLQVSSIAVIPGLTPTPAVIPTPLASPPVGGPVTTRFFKIAETPAGLDSAQQQAYTTDPMVIDYEFANATPGPKFIWVEFIASDGTTSKQGGSVELVAAGSVSPQPEMTPTPAVSPAPSPTPTPAATVGPSPVPKTCPDGSKPIKTRPGVGDWECSPPAP